MEQLNLLSTEKPEEVTEQEVSLKTAEQPLAARMRPRTLEEYLGQKHLLAPGKLLRRAIDADRFSSIILAGPPGVGKTSLAELIARHSLSAFIRLSGVSSTVKDIRREVAAAEMRQRIHHRHTILFIDEIHRFNKAQQDALLPDVESGNIRLIGATTHNPYFYVIAPLLSRSLTFQLEALSKEDITELLERTITDERAFPDRNIELLDKAKTFLADICEGDARKALTALEVAVLTTEPDAKQVTHIDLATAEESIQKRMINYGDDGHYDTASAFIKSMRGSDADAAVYWLAKMLHAGEDIRFIARRIVIFASEDIGNADPRALQVAVSAMQGIEMIGMPEARIILSQAVTYCATAPKSNASYKAVDTALEDIAKERVQPVPVHLRDAHSTAGKESGHGKGYKYPHSHGGFVVQEYLGIDKSYYEPAGIGYEEKIKERINYWRQCRKAAQVPESNDAQD
jgi:putative ATPase